MTAHRGSDTFSAVRLLGLTLLSLLAACRFGFDSVAPTDAAMVDVPPDGPPPDVGTVLGCAPVRFAIDAATSFVTAVGTQRGYAVFTVDDTGAVRGYAYQFVTDTRLEQVAGTGTLLPVPSSIGPVAAIAVEHDAGDDVDVVIAVPYPDPAVAAATRMTGDPAGLSTTPVGTVVIPFNAQLQRVDKPPMATRNDGLVAGPGALAGGDGGAVAFLGRNSGGSLGLQPVSRRGVAVAGGPHAVDTSNHAVTRQTLLRAASGYLAVWSDNDSLPHEAIVAATIDDSLAAHAPVTISVDANHGSFVPAAAYLPSAHRYLFGWMEKPGRDFIHLSMRDEQLASAPGAIDVMQEGNLPILAAGDNDFLVVWPDTSPTPTQRLGAARVAPDGSFLLRGVTSTGGDAVAFDVAVHNGQPALFWVEKDGVGPNLWIDPLCL
jgi:hypothetical protein